MPVLAAAAACLVGSAFGFAGGRSRSTPFRELPLPRKATIASLDEALEKAKAGLLRREELEIALGTVHVVCATQARELVGLEAELEGAVRLLDAMGNGSADGDGLPGLSPTARLIEAVLDVDHALAGMGERFAAPLRPLMKAVWQAIPLVEQHMATLEDCVCSMHNNDQPPEHSPEPDESCNVAQQQDNFRSLDGEIYPACCPRKPMIPMSRPVFHQLSSSTMASVSPHESDHANKAELHRQLSALRAKHRSETFDVPKSLSAKDMCNKDGRHLVLEQQLSSVTAVLSIETIRNDALFQTPSQNAPSASKTEECDHLQSEQDVVQREAAGFCAQVPLGNVCDGKANSSATKFGRLPDSGKGDMESQHRSAEQLEQVLTLGAQSTCAEANATRGVRPQPTEQSALIFNPEEGELTAERDCTETHVVHGKKEPPECESDLTASAQSACTVVAPHRDEDTRHATWCFNSDLEIASRPNQGFLDVVIKQLDAVPTSQRSLGVLLEIEGEEPIAYVDVSSALTALRLKSGDIIY